MCTFDILLVTCVCYIPVYEISRWILRVSLHIYDFIFVFSKMIYRLHKIIIDQNIVCHIYLWRIRTPDLLVLYNVQVYVNIHVSNYNYRILNTQSVPVNWREHPYMQIRTIDENSLFGKCTYCRAYLICKLGSILHSLHNLATMCTHIVHGANR